MKVSSKVSHISFETAVVNIVGNLTQPRLTIPQPTHVYIANATISNNHCIINSLSVLPKSTQLLNSGNNLPTLWCFVHLRVGFVGLHKQKLNICHVHMIRLEPLQEQSNVRRSRSVMPAPCGQLFEDSILYHD